MRCFKCGSFTPFVFCSLCLKILSDITPKTRVEDGLKIFSFYDFSDIKELLYSKHQMHGAFVFKALSKVSFKKFALNFNSEILLNALPIDDKNTSGYSHTAILANALKSPRIKPVFHALHAQNSVSYSGKDLVFRLKNPRNFKILKPIKHPVILVDDIVTTGQTILQARKILEKHGVSVLCAIVLADARF